MPFGPPEVLTARGVHIGFTATATEKPFSSPVVPLGDDLGPPE